ncbi:hypothetical protein [Enterobacter hormaechei]|uniref:hypothetical protein n=1 Tax=unclassified Serratia (in: enterobacteria) TaxID=2647522 RepID=UPI002FD5CC99
MSTDMGSVQDASRGSFSTFGIATSCQTLDLTGWQNLVNNLTLYGNPPESTVMKMDARRALQMNTAVEEKYKVKRER